MIKIPDILNERIDTRVLWLIASHVYVLVVTVVASHLHDFLLGLGFVGVPVLVFFLYLWRRKQT